MASNLINKLDIRGNVYPSYKSTLLTLKMFLYIDLYFF